MHHFTYSMWSASEKDTFLSIMLYLIIIREFSCNIHTKIEEYDSELIPQIDLYKYFNY